MLFHENNFFTEKYIQIYSHNYALLRHFKYIKFTMFEVKIFREIIQKLFRAATNTKCKFLVSEYFVSETHRTISSILC